MTHKEELLNKENQTGKNPEKGNPNLPVRVLTASSVIGENVESPTGEHLGKIKDIMLDIHGGTIEYFVLEFGGFLGLGEKLFAIPVEAIKIKPSHRSFVIHQTKEQLQNAPGFDKKHWPETNAHLINADAYWGNFMGPSAGGGSAS